MFTRPSAEKSGTIRDPLTHDARGPERQHEYQHDESKDVLIVTTEHARRQVSDVPRTQALDQPEQNPTEHRAVDVAYATKHRRRKSLEPRSETHRELR